MRNGSWHSLFGITYASSKTDRVSLAGRPLTCLYKPISSLVKEESDNTPCLEFLAYDYFSLIQWLLRNGVRLLASYYVTVLFAHSKNAVEMNVR